MLINRKFGDYVLLRRLAVGGQSEVFLAQKLGPRDFVRPVVIKALPSRLKEDERFVDLFFKEAFVSSRFTHPNVVTVHDAKEIEGELCLVMDFIAGQTVADIAGRGFKQGTPLSLTHSIQIIADACDGLHYAHQFQDLDESTYSIVHCDISPQNIMVTYHGVTKVFDFGIAHIPGYEETNTPVTVGGKYAYMSPEQIRGDAVDPRSDLFSLGIILYELSTGYRLFRRSSQPEVIKAVCEETIRPPTELQPELPMFLERVVMKALQRDPAQRYATAAAMRDDLLQLLAMMSKGSGRASLGEYVSGLFVEDRKEIAKTLRMADDGGIDDSVVGSKDSGIEDIVEDFAPFDEETMELDGEAFAESMRAEKEREDGIARAQRLEQRAADEEDARAAQASERAAALGDEVRRLQRRQSYLILFILLLLAATAVLGALQFRASSQKEEVVEISDRQPAEAPAPDAPAAEAGDEP